MSVLPQSVQKVIDEFENLPGVGSKTAARMAFHYLRNPNKEATKLAKALLEMDVSIKICKHCFSISDSDECDICTSKIRDKTKLCVVEEPLDLITLENSAVFNGLYFVLGGVISPMDGIDIEHLRFNELVKRVKELSSDVDVLEIILALNPSLEGEATSTYIYQLLNEFVQSKKVLITKLAMGLPTGADLEYADSLTLKKALEGRH